LILRARVLRGARYLGRRPSSKPGDGGALRELPIGRPGERGNDSDRCQIDPASRFAREEGRHPG